MRLMLTLEARADGEYDSMYYHKLRGLVWNTLCRYGDYSDSHSNSSEPTFCFSNPFPVDDYSQGDTRKVIISSPFDRVIETLADNFEKGDEVNIGEMVFRVVSANPFSIDVGEPGTTGVLRSASGVYVRLRDSVWDTYGIKTEYTSDSISWESEMPFGAFLDQTKKNLKYKHDAVFDDYLQSPDVDSQLFTEFDMFAEYPVNVMVSSTNNYEKTFIHSKWELEYKVRNQDHRRWLNLILDAGFGSRNTLGFGFMNLVSD